MKRCIVVMLLVVALPVFAWAQAPSNEELFQMVKELERKLDASIKEAAAAKEEAAAAKEEARKIKEEPVKAPGEAAEPAPVYPSVSSGQTTAEEKTESTPPEKRVATAAEKELHDIGGVLLPKGTLTLEPSLQYSHYSRRSISISGFTILGAIVIGEIGVSDIKRDFIQGALTARYGITSRIEAELKVPYLYTSFREVAGPGTSEITERRVDDACLGDIEGALYWHVIKEKGSIPDLIFNVRGKSHTGRSPYFLKTNSENEITELPTGNGHWGFSGGMTAVKRSDPVVIFGGLTYFWNVKDKVSETIGKVDPGDSYEGSIGMAYALSEKFSLSTTYQHRVTTKQRLNGANVPGTFINYGILTLGGGYVPSKNTFLNFTVGVGVTNDAPDVEIRLSMPIGFKIF
jgi:hypothetical protein